MQQSVKEVVQGLIDDGLVNSDKIGISNYYWSYPSAAEGAVRHLRQIKSLINNWRHVFFFLPDTIKRATTANKDGSGAKEEWGAKTRNWIGTARPSALGKLSPMDHPPIDCMDDNCHLLLGWAWQDPQAAQGTAGRKQGSCDWDATLQGQWPRNLQGQR